jgi:ABC-type nitrate/sulfonate/bicarbonate transport system permease component
VKSRSFLPVWVLHVLFAAGVVGVWQLLVLKAGNEVLFPNLDSVAAAFWDLTSSGKLGSALLASLRLLFTGFTIAFLFAFVLGVVMGYSRPAGLALLPLMSFIYCVPLIALLPLLLMWFGFGFTGRMVVVAYASFFPVLLNVYAGVRETPPDLMEVARSIGLTGRLALFRHVVLPSSMPFVMAGFRLGIGRAVVGMAIAEVFLRLGGIGALIVENGARFRTAYVIAAIIPLPILGIALTKAAGSFEQRIQYWRYTTVSE